MTKAVEFCNWCPTPNSPSTAYHVGGSAAHVQLKRGDIVKVDGVAKECTVLAVHGGGKDVLVIEDPRWNNGTWVAVEQVTKVRDGQ